MSAIISVGRERARCTQWATEAMGKRRRPRIQRLWSVWLWRLRISRRLRLLRWRGRMVDATWFVGVWWRDTVGAFGAFRSTS